jgi:GDPmannose 4,6-dehydratase
MNDAVVLITGAAGQDGRLLARRLLAQGMRVVGLVRRAENVVEGGVEKVVCDVGNADALAGALSRVRPARIFHLAARHHSSEGSKDDQAELSLGMVRVNFLAAATIVEWMAAHARAARAVFAGSSQMFPAPGMQDRRIDETTQAAPRTFYGTTKAWVRDLARHARETLGLHAGFAILFNHESALRGSGFVTRRIVDAAAAGRAIELANIGARADWSAAADIVEALDRMAAAPAPGEYVLGSGAAHSVRDWADIACARAGADRTLVSARADEASGALVADCARAAHELGWRPTTDFRALVEEMTDAAVREFRYPGTGR